MSTEVRRIGILGGAFNPPHAGHLRLAELALSHLDLAEVRFIPTAQSPHKPTEGTEGQVRLGLLKAALEATGLPFLADPVELLRGGVSYTVDTLEILHQHHPEAGWILLVGSDQVPGLPSWWRLDRILELASMAIAPRPGHELAFPECLRSRIVPVWTGAPGECVVLPGTQLDLASSSLRHRIRLGDDPAGLPIQVRDAIHRENLYR